MNCCGGWREQGRKFQKQVVKEIVWKKINIIPRGSLMLFSEQEQGVSPCWRYP